MTLVPVKTPEQVEWLRVQRNRPELYKWFRQDKPITPEQQTRWWRGVSPRFQRLFIVEDDGRKVGYVGFNPLSLYGKSAEFGIFIIPEEQSHGYGTAALTALLAYGFDDIGLSLIYSDVLLYPDAPDRFSFYEKFGFERYPDNCQHISYRKQGARIPSLRFFMSSDRWRERRDPKREGALADGAQRPASGEPQKKRARRGRPPGKRRLQAAAR